MAAFDKWNMARKLVALGWEEVDAPEGRRGTYLKPPARLFENAPQAFYVYDARDLQNLLGVEVPEDDE